MNKEKFTREVNKSLAELHSYILKVDYMGIKRVSDKIQNLIMVVNGLKKEVEIKKSMGEYIYAHPICHIDTELMRNAISNILLITEIKYPEETIYGKKLDSRSMKQRDMLEWYILLKQEFKKVEEVIQDV